MKLIVLLAVSLCIVGLIQAQVAEKKAEVSVKEDQVDGSVKEDQVDGSVKEDQVDGSVKEDQVDGSVKEDQVEVSVKDDIRERKKSGYGYKKGKRVYRIRYKYGKYGCQDMSGSSSAESSDDISNSFSNECFD